MQTRSRRLTTQHFEFSTVHSAVVDIGAHAHSAADYILVGHEVLMKTERYACPILSC